MRVGNVRTGARLRIVVEPGIAIGPGKAALLEQIARTGSISAAQRELGMSYKRAWSLIEEMNRDFAAPLVATNRGGSDRGGAALTELGDTVLGLYRHMEETSNAAIAGDLAAMRALLPRGDGAS